VNNISITIKHVAFSSLGVALLALPYSVKVCHAGIIVFLITWLTEGQWIEKINIVKNSLILQLLLAVFILQCISLLYSTNISQGIFALEKKIFMLLLPLAMATTLNKLSTQKINLLLYLFIISCFVGSLICIYDALNSASLLAKQNSTHGINYLPTEVFNSLNPETAHRWGPFSYIALAKGINIHPSYFALYLAFCVISLLTRLKEKNHSKILSKNHSKILSKNHSKILSILYWSLLFYFSLFVVCLSSRIIILGLLLTLGFIIVDGVLHLKSKASTTLLLLTLISTVLLVLYFNPVSRYRNIQEFTVSSLAISPGNEYNNSLQIRASVWWLALHSFQSVNPIVGTGIGDVTDVMMHTSKNYNVTNILNTYDPHNQYLFTLLSTGIAGLLVLIIFLIAPLYLAFLQKDYLYILFSCLFILLCITETALEIQKGIAFYTLFFSLLAFQRNSYQLFTLTTKLNAHAKQ
jgi:O-antigen ligase